MNNIAQNVTAQFTDSLSLSLAKLNVAEANHFVTWVTEAPYTRGKVHQESVWSPNITQAWLLWQQMFSLQKQMHLPITATSDYSLPDVTESHGSRLMQGLGTLLWSWLFSGAISNSLAQSQGIAMGQNQALRVRLDLKDPNLTALPWEIMQKESGSPALSLNQQILFSRTSSDVEPLANQIKPEKLSILLVLGANFNQLNTSSSSLAILELENESASIAEAIKNSSPTNTIPLKVPTQVDTLVQPTPKNLIETLDTGDYNIFFYAGHGATDADGGMLFLRPDASASGTELAQVLVRNQLTLAVFNACWGAQPAQQGQTSIERSSLAEVLLHHGVPAVLGMRDSIADEEAITFIQAFTKALGDRMPIDRAVTLARQELVTAYGFNQPAWTLPILYMHPEFDGELIPPIDENVTQLPETHGNKSERGMPTAYLRYSQQDNLVWQIRDGITRIGRGKDNNVVVPERHVSQKHAEIFYRENDLEQDNNCYYYKDFSRFGTLMGVGNEWRKIHHTEVPLVSGVKIKLGALYSPEFEFVIDYSSSLPKDSEKEQKETEDGKT